jgi:HEAT repeat protein
VRRGASARALGELGQGSSATYLASFLAGEKSPQARRAIAEALGKLGNAKVVPEVAAALRREADTLTKVRLLETLGRLGDRRAAASIVPFLTDTSLARQDMRLSSIRGFPWNTPVCDAAAWAIAKLAGREDPPAVDQLAGFPNPASAKWATAARQRLETWWQKLDDKATWTLPGR